MIDFEVTRCTRRCAATDKPLAPGDIYYSVLMADGSEVVRRDYSPAAWQGAPEEAIGWWQSKMSEAGAGAAKLAPTEVALELFDRWRETHGREDAAYVLALLLVRKRVFRFSEATFSTSSADTHLLQLHCPSRGAEYEIPVAEVSKERSAEIQEELVELLYADAA